MVELSPEAILLVLMFGVVIGLIIGISVTRPNYPPRY